MSSNTELTLTFTKPGGTTVTKTKTGGQVTLGTGAVTDDELGALLANQYVEYKIEPLFLDTAGTWSVYLTYTNTSVRGNGSFGHDPQAAFSDKSASYQLLTLDRDAGTLTSELKALDDGRVLDRQVYRKRAR